MVFRGRWNPRLQSTELREPQTFIGTGPGFSTELPALASRRADSDRDNRIGLYIGDTWKIRPKSHGQCGLRGRGILAAQTVTCPPSRAECCDPTCGAIVCLLQDSPQLERSIQLWNGGHVTVCAASIPRPNASPH